MSRTENLFKSFKKGGMENELPSPPLVFWSLFIVQYKMTCQVCWTPNVFIFIMFIKKLLFIFFICLYILQPITFYFSSNGPVWELVLQIELWFLLVIILGYIYLLDHFLFIFFGWWGGHKNPPTNSGIM